MRNIGLIIMREFKERVYKKSFIITTLLMPLLLALVSVAPTLIMIFAKGEAKQISVIDNSGIVADKLESNEEVSFITLVNADLQQELKNSLEKDEFGVLYIGEDIVTNPSNIQLYTNSSSSMMIEDNIADQVEEIIEQERLKEYNLENLREILDKVEVNISLSTFRNGDDEQSTASSSAASSFVGIILGFVLYFFLVIYGSIVMQSIIEEKNSRILEVLVSTVRPFDMMMGKILGVAAVAATQILVWGVLIIAMSAFVIPALIPDDIMASVEALQAGADVTAMAANGVDTGMITAMASVLDTGYIAKIVGLLLLFMVGGFLLYAAMYAAVGASVDEAQDAQQLTTPITIPIIFAFIILTMVMNDPNSPLVVWCSMIPFTSPIVMMGRVPSGIPTWEIILSLVLLYATFVFMVWIAGKIYRVGIFMHGKKPSFKDLYRWLKY
ncbi:MAG: ABC transporter permease [Alistipes sp.]|nr:ABC transporter permease [Alistipes sp.]MBQ8853244.1 ABC transporter permease [Alistipes sp.]